MNDLAVKILTAKTGSTHIFSAGQAGFIIKSSSGQLLAIDLYLSDCVERGEKSNGFKRLLPKLLTPYELDFDVLITTHPHMDHYDLDAVPGLMHDSKTKLFASVDCEAEVKHQMIPAHQVTYVRPGDRITAGDFDIEFVNCDHGKGAPDAVGVIVNVDGKRIYEAGDTCLRLDRVDEYLANGSIDVMMAPINGAYGNMNEEECAEFADALKAGLTIPCHYGMFASHGGNPGKFKNVMDEKYPQNAYLLMCMGECVTL